MANSAPVGSSNLLASALQERYRDAYKVSDSTVALGKGMKSLSPVIGGATIVVMLLVNVDGSVKAISCVVGVAVILAAFFVGTVIAAQGQMMRSLIDTAVNTSPLIDPEQKAKVMKLKPVERPLGI